MMRCLHKNGGIMPICVSTKDVIRKERLPYWSDLVGNILGRLEMISSQANSFNGAISYSQQACLPLATVASTPLQVLRPERFISGVKEDVFKINFHLKGQAVLHQAGQVTELQPGQWVIYDNTRPYELHFHSDYHQLLFLVPRQQLLNKIPKIDHLIAQPLSSQTSTGKVLFDTAHSILHESDLLHPSVASHMSNMLLDLLVLSLNEHANVRTPIPPPSTSCRLIQIKQFIEEHLQDPDLSVEMIAQRLYLSKRTLHTVFQNTNITISRYIWQRRLEKCYHALTTPQQANLSISQIAFSWGFNSSSHFSRLFKSQYGISARQYRLQQRDCTLSQNMFAPNQNH